MYEPEDLGRQVCLTQRQREDVIVFSHWAIQVGWSLAWLWVWWEVQAQSQNMPRKQSVCMLSELFVIILNVTGRRRLTWWHYILGILLLRTVFSFVFFNPRVRAHAQTDWWLQENIKTVFFLSGPQLDMGTTSFISLITCTFHSCILIVTTPAFISMASLVCPVLCLCAFKLSSLDGISLLQLWLINSPAPGGCYWHLSSSGELSWCFIINWSSFIVCCHNFLLFFFFFRCFSLKQKSQI